MDTENAERGRAPVQTSFHFIPSSTIASRHLLLERGAHKRSPTGALTPFYQDPVQRIAALDMQHPSISLAFPVEALLKLARDRRGCKITWDEWREHVVVSPLRQATANAWVSGCRLFRFKSGPKAHIDVYDFSTFGRARFGGEETDKDMGMVRTLQPNRAKLRFERVTTQSVVENVPGNITSFKLGDVSVLLQLSLSTRLTDALPRLRRRAIRGMSCTYGRFNGSRCYNSHSWAAYIGTTNSTRLAFVLHRCIYVLAVPNGICLRRFLAERWYFCRNLPPSGLERTYKIVETP